MNAAVWVAVIGCATCTLTMIVSVTIITIRDRRKEQLS